MRCQPALFPCFAIEKVIMPNLFHRLRQACVLLPALACAYAHAEPFAYVPNEKSGTLSVIDTATDQVVRQIAAGKRPRGIAADGFDADHLGTKAGEDVAHGRPHDHVGEFDHPDTGERSGGGHRAILSG